MTAVELKDLFYVLYNNALAGAPGLDNYEISTYLTNSQESMAKQAYADSQDPSGSFESREYNRRMISELVVDEKVTSSISSDRGLVADSKFYELSNEVMFIVLETATINDPGTIYNNKIIEVKPTTHDEFMRSYKSPFRKPNQNKAWRVDLSKEGSKTTVEIVSAYPLLRYNARYVKYPAPIIVSDLTSDAEVGGLGLTINGQTAPATSELNDLAHRDIVEKAVLLAVRDYRDGTLQSKAQVK